MKKFFLVGCALLLLTGSSALAQSSPEPLIFTGSADYSSQPFEVTAKEWQINWEFKAEEKKPPTFVLYVFPEGDQVNWTELVKTPTFDLSGSTYLYKGEGKYYVKVRAKNIASWRVVVERKGAGSLATPATFSGSADMTTPPFKVNGKEFKINYVMDTAVVGGQSIAVYPRGETENYIDTATIGAGSGTRTVEGPGEFYLKIQCTAVKSWKINVTE